MAKKQTKLKHEKNLNLNLLGAVTAPGLWTS